MRGQKSTPPKKNLASLRVGSLHANKEGRLFKVVRLASNKKVWRVARAKPKPKPKKPKPKQRALKGGRPAAYLHPIHDSPFNPHLESHHMLKHMACQISRMDADTKIPEKPFRENFVATFKLEYGDLDCFPGRQPLDKTVLLDFVTYLKEHTRLGNHNEGCKTCLRWLHSPALGNYIQFFGNAKVKQALRRAKSETSKLIEVDPEYQAVDAFEISSHEHTSY